MPRLEIGAWFSSLPWAVIATWVGIAINLFWNWRNHKRANQTRADAIRLDEFKRLRTSVDLALAGLTAVRSSLRALEASGQSEKALRTQIEALNKEASTSFGNLQSALAELDASSFAGGEDWVIATSDVSDALFSEFDKAYAPRKKEAEVLLSVAAVGARIDDLNALVKKRLGTELQKYAR
jgi:hypothetical protein